MKRKEEQHMKKKEEKTLLWKLKRQNQGLGLTRQMVGTIEEL